MPPKKSAGKSKAVIASVRHKDKRVNIPTEELRDFVAADEVAPRIMLYPRDPSLDPQLVWKGKDEQDAKDLAVPVLPIYIQEKIHPQALVEDLRDAAKAGAPEPQQSLFADFNGIEGGFDRKVEFYQHEGHWSNRMILGDSLLVMTSLAEKEGLKGKVQTIYFDPPYGIKFGSNWQVSTRKRDVKDGKQEDATRQPEQVRAFRDTWKMGIHSYLAYLRDRLTAAAELLTETGSIFVQIGDENVHVVRCVLDEVFGSENCCGVITFQKTTGQSSPNATTNVLTKVADYLLWYAKSLDHVKYRELFVPKGSGSEDSGNYKYVEIAGERRSMTAAELAAPTSLGEHARIFRYGDITSAQTYTGGSDPFTFNGKTFIPPAGRGWSTKPEGLHRLAWADRLHGIGNTLSYVRYLDDFPVTRMNNIWGDTVVSGFGTTKSYVVETLPEVVRRAILMTTDPGDLVLDPTCGSGTTAFVAEQWGRRWITVDTSRVALALARTRLMSSKYPYFLLADSPAGVKKEAELSGKSAPIQSTHGDIKRGFVCKRVPHVTLKSIANNPDIKPGMKRPEIDAAIARHSELELLHDRPYEDQSMLRVSGPFTVESLSPHRVLSTDYERPKTEKRSQGEASRSFESMILDHLRTAGVQNTKKGERLKFERLDPFAGTWINAAGEFVGADGKTKRAAVAIGPEHGTVGTQLVKEAAKEAVQGVGFDVLVVCGFAFDPHVSEEAKRYGKLVVLPTRMNPDLAMGEELLKKTGAANLFMVFGEPDVDIKPQKDGKLVVEIRGVDVYDPTTGAVRSSTTDDIACWFIDTDYDGESFFVRHAYFTGADEPYEKLKRALRAEIDEAAWSALYSTKSRPFPRPKAGKIAIKVINHFGDEVLKVFSIK